jgi:DNA modification methylase
MLNVEYRSIPAFRANPRHARKHPKKQVARLARGIEEHGFNVPVLIDKAGMILAGHARVEAARQARLESVPVIVISHLSETEARAFVLFDNRIAEGGEWRRDVLALEFEALLEVDADLALTGFELPEIDVVLDEARESGADEGNVGPAPGSVVSRRGDLWLLGAHRLLCGSALEGSDYVTLMTGELADVVFTDSLYNVPIGGHVLGLGRTRHREFAIAAGEMGEGEFTGFLQTAFGHMAAHSRDGSIHVQCMDWRNMREILAAADGIYDELKNLCVWAKDNGGMGSLYRSRHELVFVFKKGRAPHVNAVELGRFGHNRTNVWEYPGQNTFHRDRAGDLAAHPTVKPTALVADAIRDVSHRGAIVLDPFCGSGTTILAAERCGRGARDRARSALRRHGHPPLRAADRNPGPSCGRGAVSKSPIRRSGRTPREVAEVAFKSAATTPVEPPSGPKSPPTLPGAREMV